MKEVVVIALAFFRFVAHALATAIGFAFLGAVTLIPFKMVHYLVPQADPDVVHMLQILQTLVFYVDITTFVLTILALFYLYLKSLWEAVR